MTDKELLEYAAKAAGYKHEVTPIDPQPNRPAYWSYWNPLINDGDALRLAVKLDIEFYQANDEGMASYAAYWGVASHGDVSRLCVIEYHADLINNNDPYAATRRAIVRAAAEIGKEMK